MFEWGNPLWFMAIPLVLVPLLSRRGRLAFSSLQLVQRRHSLRTLLAWVPQALCAMGIGFLIVALARPQEVNRERMVEHEGIDILLVLDTSGSMEIDDYNLSARSVSRLVVAREVIADFVEGRPHDRVGLVVFGEEAFTSVPLTLDHKGMASFLRQIQIGIAGERRTAIGDAIAIAAQRLKDLDAQSRVMILLTDGQSNAGQIEPLDAAEAAASLGIRIYTVGIGTPGGRQGMFGFFSARGDGLDEETLQAIAELSGGQYFRATDTQALRQVYETIDRLEKSTAEITELVIRDERYHWPLQVGLFLIIVHWVLKETVLRRLP